jgi:hypothetical protein
MGPSHQPAIPASVANLNRSGQRQSVLWIVSLRPFGVTACRVVNLAVARVLAACLDGAVLGVLLIRRSEGDVYLVAPSQSGALVMERGLQLARFAIGSSLAVGHGLTLGMLPRRHPVRDTECAVCGCDSPPARFPCGFFLLQGRGLLYDIVLDGRAHRCAAVPTHVCAASRIITVRTTTFRPSLGRATEQPKHREANEQSFHGTWSALNSRGYRCAKSPNDQ